MPASRGIGLRYCEPPRPNRAGFARVVRRFSAASRSRSSMAFRPEGGHREIASAGGYRGVPQRLKLGSKAARNAGLKARTTRPHYRPDCRTGLLDRTTRPHYPTRLPDRATDRTTRSDCPTALPDRTAQPDCPTEDCADPFSKLSAVRRFSARQGDRFERRRIHALPDPPNPRT